MSPALSPRRANARPTPAMWPSSGSGLDSPRTPSVERARTLAPAHGGCGDEAHPPSVHPPAPPCPDRVRRRPTPDFVDRRIARDETAYQDLVRDHGPRVLAVAGRGLPRAHDAEEALQDAFVDVLRLVPRFPLESRLETWLHRIVVNCSWIHLRGRRRKPETAPVPSALDDGAAPPGRRGPPPSAHEVVAAEVRRAGVRASIDRPPEAPRSPLRIRHVEGLEVREIAAFLDLGISTTNVALHRARLRLQHALGPRPALEGSR